MIMSKVTERGNTEWKDERITFYKYRNRTLINFWLLNWAKHVDWKYKSQVSIEDIVWLFLSLPSFRKWQRVTAMQ